MTRVRAGGTFLDDPAQPHSKAVLKHAQDFVVGPDALAEFFEKCKASPGACQSLCLRGKTERGLFQCAFKLRLKVSAAIECFWFRLGQVLSSGGVLRRSQATMFLPAA